MIKEATAMAVRQRLGDLLNEVRYRRGKIVITKAGKPVVVLDTHVIGLHNRLF